LAYRSAPPWSDSGKRLEDRLRRHENKAPIILLAIDRGLRLRPNPLDVIDNVLFKKYSVVSEHHCNS
jgi:hypothetical protein